MVLSRPWQDWAEAGRLPWLGNHNFSPEGHFQSQLNDAFTESKPSIPGLSFSGTSSRLIRLAKQQH